MRLVARHGLGASIRAACGDVCSVRDNKHQATSSPRRVKQGFRLGHKPPAKRFRLTHRNAPCKGDPVFFIKKQQPQEAYQTALQSVLADN